MTDVADLGIRVTGSEQVDRNTASLDKLVVSSDRAAKAEERLYKAYLQTRTALQERIDKLTGVQRAESDAEKSARSIAVALINQENAHRELNREIEQGETALQRQINAMVGLENSVQNAATSARILAGAEEAYRNSLQQTLMTIDPLYASSQRYEAAINQIDEALRREIITQEQANRARLMASNYYLSASETAVNSSNRMAAAQLALEEGTQGFSSTMRGARGALQNVSWQIQDVAVQMQMGTDAAIIFAQQGSQIVSAFGPVGAAIGAALAVTPLLALAFTDAGESAAGGKSAVDEFGQALTSYVSFVNDAASTTEELSERFGVFASQVRGFAEFMAQVSLDEALASADDVVAGMRTDIDTVIMQLERIDVLQQQVAQTREYINQLGRSPIDVLNAEQNLQQEVDAALELASAIGLTVGQAQSLRDALVAVRDARVPEDLAQGASRVLSILTDVRTETGRLPPELQAMANAMDEVLRKSAEASNAAKDLFTALRSAVGAADNVASAVTKIGTAAGGALSQVKNLATALWDAAKAREQAIRMVPGQGLRELDDERGSQAEGVADIARMRREQRLKELGIDSEGNRLPDTSRGGLGSGSGSGSVGEDDFEDRLERLQEELQMEREIADEWYEENMAILQDRRATEFLGEQEHKALLEALEIEHQQRLANINMEASQRRLSEYSSLFGALASIAAVGGQKTARAMAIFQAIEGTINAYGAAIKALNTPGIGLAGRFAAYASVLAAGLRGVAAIRSAGGGAGGAAAGAMSTPSLSSALPDTRNQTSTISPLETVDQGGPKQEPVTIRWVGDTNRRFTYEEVQELVTEIFKTGQRGRNSVPGVVFG